MNRLPEEPPRVCTVYEAMEDAMSTPAGPTGPTTTPSPPSTPPPKSSPAFNKDVTFLYFWYRLDCLGDIGYALALDFVARPQAWTGAKNVAR